MIVAYFDFDGTLTYQDTLVFFILHTIGWLKFIFKLPLIIIIVFLYLIRLIDNQRAKKWFLTATIKGYDKNLLEKKAESFAKFKLNKHIKPEIYKKLEYHLEHKHQVIIVSANLAIYLRYWIAIHKIQAVIATEIEFNNNKATGALKRPNCYGSQKIKRIVEYLQDNNTCYEYSYGYGNSRGDYELLNYVDEGFLIHKNSFNSWLKNARN